MDPLPGTYNSIVAIPCVTNHFQQIGYGRHITTSPLPLMQSKVGSWRDHCRRVLVIPFPGAQTPLKESGKWHPTSCDADMVGRGQTAGSSDAMAPLVRRAQAVGMIRGSLLHMLAMPGLASL